MKPLSNTTISALFAVGITALVALSLEIPYFLDKETQTSDEMILLRYQLHQKYSPIKPDPHVVIAAIDQKSLSMLGRWPFNRSIHGDFLILLAPEKPKTVGWDIFFTEVESVPAAAEPPPAAQPAVTPADASPASGTNNAPATAPTPEAQPTSPAPSSPPPETNAPSSAPATAAPGPTTGIFRPDAMLFGADLMSNEASAVAPPASQPTAPPPVADSSNAPSPSTPSNPLASDATQAAPPQPAAPTPEATNQPPKAPALDADDQHFVDAASLIPGMVTAAEATTDIEPEITPESILPTRILKHVIGDTSKLLSMPYGVLPFPELRKVSYIGFANENGESGGGSRRKDPLVVNVGGKIMASFDLQVLMQYWGADSDQVTVDLGREIVVPRADGTKAYIPIDEKGQLTLNYRANVEDFNGMSYFSMMKGLNDKAAGEKSEEAKALPSLKDSIVIVGVTFNGTDAGPTPLNTNSPLVVTHLNALTNILQQDYMRQVSWWMWMPIYALFLFVTGSLMLRVGIAPMIPIGLLALFIWAVAGFALIYFASYTMPVSSPEIGILLLAGAVPTKRFFGEEREKIKVKKAMSAYLSDKIMEKVLSNPDGVKLGGVKQVITIMFCDIRGFTTYCDNRDPEEVLHVVNDYFEEMTKVVFKYEGTVDKYIGDCIMAFWNAPEPQADHAQRAVCCAMEMRYALANFKVKRAGLDTELFECGIGIHTGEALVGNMGSSLKVNYTAMGSTVNLGARLESLTKKLNERILISHDTFMELQGDFPITDRGEALVPGFANPIHVYGVGAEQDLTSALKVGMKLAKKQDYTAEEVTKPIWAPAPLPEDADPNP